MGNVDYRKLKLFFMSLLWRASATSHLVYALVSLEHDVAERLRQQVLRLDPGSERDFSVLGSVFVRRSRAFPKLDPSQMQLNPHVCSVLGAKAVRYYLNQFTFFINIDSTPWPDTVGPFLLRDDGLLRLVERDFDSSSELRSMLDIARASPA